MFGGKGQEESKVMDKAVKLVSWPTRHGRFRSYYGQPDEARAGGYYYCYCTVPVIYHGSSRWRDPLDPLIHPRIRMYIKPDKRGLHVYSTHVLLGHDMIQDKALLPVRYFGRTASSSLI